MSLKERIDADIKSAMLSSDREVADVLRGLKSAILNEEIASNQRENGLSDEAVEKVIAREVKKRDEAAELYAKGGNQVSADKERAERELLGGYLPEQLSDEALTQTVQETVNELGADTHMGKVIGAVKQKVGNQADGTRIAAAVQKVLNS